MEQEKNVVVKKGCHSRGMLSGIYNACRCHNQGKTLLNRCVEDPRLQISGMTPNLMGFTLIELLVVVLIIGILAAIAVPQYKVAVTKSRITQMLPLINAIDKAEQVYFLANGQYTQNAQEASKLDLDLPPGGQIIGNEVVYPRKFFCRLPTSTKSIKCTLDNLSIERWLIPLTAYDNAKTICWAENNTAWHAKVCKTFGGIQREHSSTTLTLYTLD